MGVDTSITHAIFFIAAVVVAVALAAAFTGIIYSMSEDIEDKSDAMSDEILTEILIINDPIMVPYENSNLTLYVKNIGSTYLMPDDVVVMIDGQIMNVNVELLEAGAQVCNPAEVMKLTVEVTLTSGDHRAKVIASSGSSDTMAFRI